MLPKPLADPPPSDTALGDWYGNTVVVDRQPLLLLVSSKSLLSIVVPARNLKLLPQLLPDMIEARLKRLPVTAHVVSCEVAASQMVAVAKTNDRSVLGNVVDFAKLLSFIIPERRWGDADLRDAEARLAEAPCRCSGPDEGVIWPEQTAIQLLQSTWPSNPRKH